MAKPKFTAVELIVELDLAGWPFIRLLCFDDHTARWQEIDHWHGLESNSFTAMQEAMSTFGTLADRLIESSGVEPELPFP